ncbi:MAG: arginine--tRNA ligase [Candidatus Buchananbacteria bacterium]
MAKINKHFSQAETKVRKEIIDLINKILGKKFSAKVVAVEYPPQNQNNLGDFTVSCFLLAKKLKKSPVEIASQVAGGFTPTGLLVKVLASGPYLNFFVNRQIFSKLVLTEIYKAKANFGKSKIGKNQKVMVEYFSPNTNKPLTIGHVRNICLGQSIVRLMKFCGYKITQTTLYNNRGIAIAKAILGYQKWGDNQTPKSSGLKPDHFVGSFYVKFCQEAKDNPALDAEAQKVLQAWEEEKREPIEIWEKLMVWVLEGFKQTLEKLGAERFDEEYYESEYYRQGKDVVEKGLKQGVFVKDKDGVILAPLQKFGLPDKIVLRPDDTSLYITQDLYLAYLKDKYQLDSSIYVVGSEQDLYFQQLFKILELLGFVNAKNYHHLSYGMIRLPSGKIKSREGLIKGTGADDLLAELEELAKAEVSKRDSGLAEKEVEQRASQIALAALRFYILSVNPKTTMIFDPKKSIAFTGKTGPYLQYVTARISSIFAKEKIKITHKVDYSVLETDIEFSLIKLLSRFPNFISQAVIDLDPACLVDYLYDLAKAFSLFYEKLPILQSDQKVKQARVLLISDVKNVLALGLELLAIPVPEKM